MVVAREAAHVLVPPSIMALPGKNDEHRTGDLRSEAPSTSVRGKQEAAFEQLQVYTHA